MPAQHLNTIIEVQPDGTKHTKATFWINKSRNAREGKFFAKYKGKFKRFKTTGALFDWYESLLAQGKLQ